MDAEKVKKTGFNLGALFAHVLIGCFTACMIACMLAATVKFIFWIL